MATHRMRFILHDLGNVSKGRVVEVQLKGSAANVQLLDSSNLSNYKAGRKYHYYGGLAKQSPVHIRIPSTGHWYVAVDMLGLRGNVHSSARLLPEPLPTIPQRPLADFPSLVHNTGYVLNEDAGISPDYDVFISHASEDKDEVVRPLAYALVQRGIKVWYDEFELHIGDSLRRKIDRGLANSRFGVVVISRSFIKKGWTNYELDGIMTKAVSGEQVLLPIWHDITKKEVLDYSPSLVDKVARDTTTNTIEEIADEIAGLIMNA